MYSVNVNVRPLQECQHEFALCESRFWCATIFHNSIKEHEYVVVSMKPRTENSTADATPVRMNHLQ